VQQLLAIPGEVQGKLTGLLQTYNGDRQKILGILNQVTSLTPATLQNVSDNAVWTYIADNWGSDLASLINNQPAFQTLVSEAQKLEQVLSTDPGQLLTNYWNQIEQRTGLDKLAQ